MTGHFFVFENGTCSSKSLPAECFATLDFLFFWSCVHGNALTEVNVVVHLFDFIVVDGDHLVFVSFHIFVGHDVQWQTNENFKM